MVNNMDTLQGIWIIAERTADGRLDETAEELMTPARQLADRLGEPLTAVLPTGGEDTGAVETRLAHLGADRVVVLKDERLASYQVECFTAALAGLAQAHKPRIVLLAASTASADFSPRLAVRTGGSLITQAFGLAVDEAGNVTATRSCYAESLLADVTASSANDGPQFVTIKKKAFPKPVADESRTAPVETVTPDLSVVQSRLRPVGVQPTESRGAKKLEEADIIVSGGRGLKEPDNFRLVEELAEALGAAVGASRAVVDAGWRPHSEQVGQTGKTVSPRVYFALGISGALQHQVGMNASQIIVAINRDEQAPIFKLADFGIIGDVLAIAPELTRTIRERQLVLHV
jgi:electron transfer flavoprotein alpha subunit